MHKLLLFLNGKVGMNQLKRFNPENQSKNKRGLF
jgi:hypothetical protein